VLLVLAAAASLYELRGQVFFPELSRNRIARVSVYAASRPYAKQTRVLNGGTFRFTKLQPDDYTISVVLRGHGEYRRTVSVGPGTADARGRVAADLKLDAMERTAGPPPGTMVSVRQLSIPYGASQDYQKAFDRLGKNDPDGALKHLEKAVAKAPHFAEAFNMMGTIHHQRRQFVLAEQRFREALKQSPASFEPVVNLGATLLSLHRLEEALAFNRRAVEMRPEDPLARAQLGWTLLRLNRAGEALEHFVRAKQIDPNHFSQPQLGLAEIFIARGDRDLAVSELEDFLRRHPDDREAARVRADIARLKKS
jgi:Tfp pilus assembly protein PilF